MALIKHANPKSLNNKDGGYKTLFSNEQISNLITRIHSTKISSGTELEKIIQEMNGINLVKDVDDFFENIDNQKIDTYLINKKYLKQSNIFRSSNVILEKEIWVDFIIVKILDKNKKHCHILELKSGSSFDTKKTPSEKLSLENFDNKLSKKIQTTTSIHICAFFEENKKIIMSGLKNIFNENEILSGIELCDLLNINYYDVMEKINKDKKENDLFFYSEVNKILKSLPKEIINNFKGEI